MDETKHWKADVGLSFKGQLIEVRPEDITYHPSSSIRSKGNSGMTYFGGGEEERMFRGGVKRTGFSSSKAPETNETLWRTDLHAFIFSSPVIVDGGIFLGAGSGAIYCLDESTGSEIWHYLTDSWIASSPAFLNGMIYIGSEDGRLYCLNEITGELMWSSELHGAVWSSPAVYEWKVLVGSHDGSLYCFSENGEILWTFSTWAPEGELVIYSSMNGSHTRTLKGGGIFSSPAVSGGRIYFGCENGIIYCLDDDDGELIWTWKTQGPIRSSPAILGGILYIGSIDGRVYALNETTGDLIWLFETGNSVRSSPAVYGGRVVIGSGDRRIYCLSSDNGNLTWSFETGGLVYSSPTIADGKVFVGSDDGYIYCLDLSTGEVFWFYETGDRVSSSPTVVNGNLYVGSYDGYLYAIGSNSVESTFPYYITLYSPHGEVQGAGGYEANSTAVFSVSPTTITSGPGVRHVFTHWTSNRIGGYSGSNATVCIVMDKAISKTAHWKTQYYLRLEVANEEGGKVSPPSGWYDTDSTIRIEAFPEQGYWFEGFKGSGEGSYTGAENCVVIQLAGPVNETAAFKRIFQTTGYVYISFITGLSVIGCIIYLVLIRRYIDRQLQPRSA